MSGSGSQKLLIPLSLRLCFSHGANLSFDPCCHAAGVQGRLSLSRATTDWWNDLQEVLFPNKWREPRRKGGYRRKRCRERTQSFDFPAGHFEVRFKKLGWRFIHINKHVNKCGLCWCMTENVVSHGVKKANEMTPHWNYSVLICHLFKFKYIFAPGPATCHSPVVDPAQRMQRYMTNTYMNFCRSLHTVGRNNASRCLEEQQVNLSQVEMETVAKTLDFC